jgi:transcription elongation factor GreA
MPRTLPIVTRLHEELAALRRELSREIPKQLEEARAHGDLSENAEYEAAKERQGILQARVGQLEGRLRELSLFSPSSIPVDIVGYGSRIEVEDVETGDHFSYELVFPEEADPSKGLISMNSPMGQALMKRNEGDEVTVRTPAGNRSLEITALTTFHDRNDLD